MDNNLSIANLLFNKECPFDYQCKAMDCMTCLERQGEEEDGK